MAQECLFGARSWDRFIFRFGVHLGLGLGLGLGGTLAVLHLLVPLEG